MTLGKEYLTKEDYRTVNEITNELTSEIILLSYISIMLVTQNQCIGIIRTFLARTKDYFQKAIHKSCAYCDVFAQGKNCGATGCVMIHDACSRCYGALG
jgi:hypothetical protein